MAKALRYRELYPADQIVFLRNRETGTDADLSEVTGTGVQIVSADLKKITDSELMVYLDQFEHIESFDIFSHSSPWGAGLEVDQMQTRLGVSTPNLGLLADNFSRFAYVTINGCSNGLYMAPVLSQIWHVPVAGALGSTDFQQLHVNGQWYFNNLGQAPSGGWADTNTISYQSPHSCQDGTCIRMKPENSKYQGLWGNFEGGGLPFYKFFCGYSGNTDDCEVSMAKNLTGSVSVRNLQWNSSLNDYREVLFDELCPVEPNTPLRENCRAGILNAVGNSSLVYSPYYDNALECNFQGCQFEFKCENDSDGYPVPGTCALYAPINTAPKTISEEYLHYLHGFELLQQHLNR